MKEQVHKIEDVKFALVAFDPDQETDVKDVLHFCAYVEQPEYLDMVSLKQELMTNPVFGLTHMGERLEIILAPENLVQSFVEEAIRMRDEEKGKSI
jgi:hypothetical protein